MKARNNPLDQKLKEEYKKLPPIVKSKGSNKSPQRVYKLRQRFLHLSNIVTASNMIDSKKLNTSGNTYAENMVEKESRRLWQD